MARVHTSRFVARLGKTLNCGRCGRAIQKGETYKWFAPGFRSSKHIRCSDCPVRGSELDSSLYSTVLAAIEDAEDNVNGLEVGDTDGLESAVRDVASACEEVADQYADAAESMGGAGEQMSEWADTLRDHASNLESWSPSDTDVPTCDEHDEPDTADCTKCTEAVGFWWDSLVEEAIEALGEVGRD